MAAIEEKVKKIISEQFNIPEEEIFLEASFEKNLKADSLEVTELMMALEEEFGITVLYEDAENITTVQRAIDYIKKATA